MTMAGRPPHYCKDCSLHFDSDTSLRVHLQYHKENLISMWAPAQQQQQQQCNNNNNNNINAKENSPSVTPANNNNACEPTTSATARMTESPSSSTPTTAAAAANVNNNNNPEVPSLLCKNVLSNNSNNPGSTSSTRLLSPSSSSPAVEVKVEDNTQEAAAPAAGDPNQFGHQTSQFHQYEYGQQQFQSSSQPPAGDPAMDLMGFHNNGVAQPPFDDPSLLRPAPPPYQSPNQYNLAGFSNGQQQQQQSYQQQQQQNPFYLQNSQQHQPNEYNGLEAASVPNQPQLGGQGQQYNQFWGSANNPAAVAIADEKPGPKDPQQVTVGSEGGFGDSSAILDLDTNRLLFHGDELAAAAAGGGGGKKQQSPVLGPMNPIKMDDDPASSWPGATQLQQRDQNSYWGQPHQHQHSQWGGGQVPYHHHHHQPQQHGFGHQNSQPGQYLGHHQHQHQAGHGMHQRIPSSVRPGMGPAAAGVNGMLMNSNSWYPQRHPAYVGMPPVPGYPSPGGCLKSLESPTSASVVPVDWMSAAGHHHPLSGGPLSPDYGPGKDEKRNRPFQCQICDKFFIRKGHLNRHLTTTAHKSRVSQANAATAASGPAGAGPTPANNCDSGISSGSSTGGDAGGSLTLDAGSVISAANSSTADGRASLLAPSSPPAVVGHRSTLNDLENLPPSSIPVPSRIYPNNPHHQHHQHLQGFQSSGSSPVSGFDNQLAVGGDVQPASMSSPSSTSTSTPTSQFSGGQQHQNNLKPPNASPILPHPGSQGATPSLPNHQPNMLCPTRHPPSESGQTGQQLFVHQMSGVDSPSRLMGLAGNNESPESFADGGSSGGSNKQSPGLMPQSYQHYHQQQAAASPSPFGPTPAKVGVGQLGFQHTMQHQNSMQQQQTSSGMHGSSGAKPGFYLNGPNGFSVHSNQLSNNNNNNNGGGQLLGQQQQQQGFGVGAGGGGGYPAPYSGTNFQGLPQHQPASFPMHNSNNNHHHHHLLQHQHHQHLVPHHGQHQHQHQPGSVFGPKNADAAPAPLVNHHQHHHFQQQHHGLMAPVPAAASAAATHQQQPVSVGGQQQQQQLRPGGGILGQPEHQQQQQQQPNNSNGSFGNSSSPPSIAQTPPMISPYSPSGNLPGQGGGGGSGNLFPTPLAGSSPPAVLISSGGGGGLDADDPGKKRLTCPICKKRSSTEAIHEEHMLVHKGEKPYKCTMCPKQFGHKTDLRRHLCLHTGEKPFACPVCGKRFIRKDHMTKHGEVHKKEDSFVMMTEFTDVGQHAIV